MFLLMSLLKNTFHSNDKIVIALKTLHNIPYCAIYILSGEIISYCTLYRAIKVDWSFSRFFCPMMREVSLETLSNVNIRDRSHDKNLPIISVTGSINQNVFKLIKLCSSLGAGSKTPNQGIKYSKENYHKLLEWKVKQIWH